MFKYTLLLSVFRHVFRLIWLLLRDRRVPTHAKIIVPIILVYIISPFDLISDFIPIIGQSDDIVATIIGISLFLMLCPSNVVIEHLETLTGRKFSKSKNKNTIVEGTSRIIQENEGENWK